VVFVILLTKATANGQGERFNPPKQYYLAVGDSIAYGYQASKARAGLPASKFNTGYVDVLTVQLQQIQPRLTAVNYGCPGETTTTFIEGGCMWTQFGQELHDAFSGSQLDAAVAFLSAHRGEVSPVTVTLWGNDVREFVMSCRDFACVERDAPLFIAHLTSNLALILTRLRAAAPDAEIIVTGAWDSYLDALPVADPLFQLLNTSMSTVAAAARVRFADPLPVFNPQGDPARELQAMCALTALCTDNDSHPTDAGYRALAEVVYQVSDYARLTR
jgi:lysophospholipase L1-like esterase